MTANLILESVSVAAKRSKRQILIARPLADHVFAQLNTPLQEAELYQSLVPSASQQVEYRSPRQNIAGPNGRWELGYDPSEILNPPEQQTSETQYRTMKSYKGRVPEGGISPDVVWGTVKQGAVIDRPQRALQEGNRGVNTRYVPHGRRQSRYSEEEDEDEEEESEEEEEEKSAEAGYSQQGHSYHHVPASIYSFVKTDPHDLAMMASSQDPYQQPGDPQGAESASGDRVRRDHHQGVTGPVHTYVKTDKHAHFKWGVRHHVGHEYAG
ncbi:hypothetical protein J6590_016857 [Homalodisca vitripennis]|nr:hypothetical protein J6590_016857 [Homalodisca vitripennis]